MGSPAPRDVFWRLLVWLLLLQVSSATNLYTAYLNVTYTFPATNHSSWLQDEIGLYGQDSPRTFVEGSVYLAEPMFGCDGDTLYRHPNASGGWVALIQRGNGCTFSDKINVAADNGAVAAVIFNDDGTDNRVIQMSHPGTSIVAVMIGHKRGMELVIRLKQGFQITIAIEVGKQHSPWMSHYSVFFVSISFFIVTAATVGYFIFYSARRLSSLRQQNCKLKKLKAEAKKAIGKLQVRTLKSGDPETGPDADACAVCIDSYKPGDVLSILTCNHFFHKSCIEPWLLEHRTCPMCKCDILKALGVEMDVEEPAQIIVADFRSFSAPEDLQSETTSHTHSETASSGYASMHGVDPLGPPENTRNDPQEEPPQYDNLAFESDAHRQHGVRT